MIKKFLIAAALLIESPAFVFSQDIFWSFESATNSTSVVGNVGDMGTAHIFSDQPFGFDALDLNFTSSDSSVLLLTGGTSLNESFGGFSTSFDSSVLTVNAADGNLFAVNVTQNGINPATSALFNPFFEAGPGSGGGAVRLAEVTYEIVGFGEATLDFSLGSKGALELPDIVLDPTFGSATVMVGIPEPSSATLWVLGATGLVARRRRTGA